jgi:hypothetical protein
MALYKRNISIKKKMIGTISIFFNNFPLRRKYYPPGERTPFFLLIRKYFFRSASKHYARRSIYYPAMHHGCTMHHAKKGLGKAGSRGGSRGGGDTPKIVSLSSDNCPAMVAAVMFFLGGQ